MHIISDATLYSPFSDMSDPSSQDLFDNSATEPTVIRQASGVIVTGENIQVYTHIQIVEFLIQLYVSLSLGQIN